METEEVKFKRKERREGRSFKVIMLKKHKILGIKDI
jgi:hypothetical protein